MTTRIDLPERADAALIVAALRVTANRVDPALARRCRRLAQNINTGLNKATSTPKDGAR